jgi:hypothetical protein
MAYSTSPVILDNFWVHGIYVHKHLKLTGSDHISGQSPPLVVTIFQAKAQSLIISAFIFYVSLACLTTSMQDKVVCTFNKHKVPYFVSSRSSWKKLQKTSMPSCNLHAADRATPRNAMLKIKDGSTIRHGWDNLKQMVWVLRKVILYQENVK